MKEFGAANQDVRVIGGKAFIVSGKCADWEVPHVEDTIARDLFFDIERVISGISHPVNSCVPMGHVSITPVPSTSSPVVMIVLDAIDAYQAARPLQVPRDSICAYLGRTLMGFHRLSLALICVSVTGFAVGSPLYTVTDIGTLGGYVFPSAINNSGQITGRFFTADGMQHAYLYTPGIGMTDLGTLGGSSSEANGINDLGQVTGSSYSSDSPIPKAFVYNPGSGMSDVGSLAGGFTLGNGINNLGQVTGQSSPAVGPSVHAFLYTPGIGITDLNNFGPMGSGTDVNDLGQVVGTSYLYTPGTGMINMGSLLGATGYASANAINNLGQVVGESIGPDGRHHAFLYETGQGMKDLGTLGPNQDSQASDINASGQIVGSSGAALGRAMIYFDGHMTDLNTLIDPTLGITLGGANGINDAGQIVAADRNYHVYLLTPVPEPASSAILILGLLAVFGSCRSMARSS